MKKIFAFTLCALVGAFNVFAAENATVEKQLKKMLSDSLISEDVEYSGELSLKENEDGYQAMVPAGVLKSTKKMFPAFSVPVNKEGKLDNNTVYHISLNKLAQIYPMIVPVFEEYQIKYDSLNYTKDLVPALSLISKETFAMSNLVIPVDQGAKVTVRKIDEKSFNEKQKDGIEGKQNIALEDIQVSHLFGSLKIDKINIDIKAPVAMGVVTDWENIDATRYWDQKMTVDNVRVDSLFTETNFNIEEIFNSETGADKKIDANLNIKVKDIFVAEQKDFPQKITLDVNFSGFTGQEVIDYEKALRTFNEVQDLPEGRAQEDLVMRAYENLQEKQTAFLKNFVVKVNEIRFDSDKYIAVLKGTGVLKDEQFNGTLTVVNFNYLAPEPKKVDEAACQAVMDKVLDGSLRGDAFEAAFNEKCNDKKGMLDALRPYASTAKRTTFEGKNALEFNIEVNGNEILINSKPFSFE